MDFLLNKLSNSFLYYTDKSFFDYNTHIYLDNYNLINQFNDICYNIHNTYNKNDLSDYNIIVKEDMHIKVFILSNCIIRICHIDTYNYKYNELYNYIIKLNHENIEHIYNIYHTNKYILIVSKCIIPLIIDNKINPLHYPKFDILINQIEEVINVLLDNGYSHNDVNIDNIGYDSELDKYILFDFDKCKKSNKTNDLYNLIKSIKYYSY